MEVRANLDLSNRGCTYSTHHEVLALVLGGEPEPDPDLVVVLLQLGSVCLVWVCHRRANRTRAI